MEIIGYIGADATITETGAKKVANFSIAHSVKRGDSDFTTWIKCAWWEPNGLAVYLKKGAQIFVAGSPSAEGYLKGNEVTATIKLTVFQIELLGSKNNS